MAQTQCWVEESLTGSLNLNDEITFFVRHGDFIGRMATFVFTLFSLMYLTMLITSRTKKKK